MPAAPDLSDPGARASSGSDPSSVRVARRARPACEAHTESPAPYRWVVLGVFMAVTAVSQLMWLALTPVARELQEASNISGGQVVFLSTVFPLLYVVLSIPAGRVIDRFGFHVAASLGAGLTAAGAVLRVVPSSYILLLVGSIVMSIGQPLILNSISKLATTWFGERESARANGLFTVSLFSGMILALGLSPAIFHAFGGDAGGSDRSDLTAIAGMSWVYAAIAAAAGLAFALLARRRPVANRVRVSPAAGSQGIGVPGKGSVFSSMRAVLSIRGFPALLIAACAGIGTLIAFLQLVEQVLQSKGVSDSASGSLGSLFVVAAAVGSFALSAVSDRSGARAVFLGASLAGTALGLVAMVLSSSEVLLSAGGIVTSVFVAATWSLSLTVSETLAGAEAAGMAASLLLLAGNLAGVVWTFAMEQLHQTVGHNRSFTAATVFLVAVAAAGIVPAIRLRRAKAPTELIPISVGFTSQNHERI